MSTKTRKLEVVENEGARGMLSIIKNEYAKMGYSFSQPEVHRTVFKDREGFCEKFFLNDRTLVQGYGPSPFGGYDWFTSRVIDVKDSGALYEIPRESRTNEFGETREAIEYRRSKEKEFKPLGILSSVFGVKQ